MAKNLQLCLKCLCLNQLAWTLPEPHISTSENLHAKQKRFFSAILRAETSFFYFFWVLANFAIIRKRL